MKVWTNRRNRGRMVWVSDKVGMIVECWQPDDITENARVVFIRYNTDLSDLKQAIQMIEDEPNPHLR